MDVTVEERANMKRHSIFATKMRGLLQLQNELEHNTEFAKRTPLFVTVLTELPYELVFN